MRKVYIKNAYYQNSGFRQISPEDKNIDTIGRICISVLDKLFACPLIEKTDVPLFFSSAFSCLKSLHQFNTISEVHGPLSVNPSQFPSTVLNAPACMASIHHHITSPIFNISTGRSSALDALQLAYLYVAHGEYHNAIVCNADENCAFSDKIMPVEAAGAALYLSSEKGGIEFSCGSYKAAQPIDQHQCVQGVHVLKKICESVRSQSCFETTLHCWDTNSKQVIYITLKRGEL